MIRLKEIGNDLLLDFNKYEDYDSFDSIIAKLKYHFKIVIEEKLDGPESRVWKLKLDDNEFTLHNNPYGNYIKASTESSKDKLRNIVSILDNLFK